MQYDTIYHEHFSYFSLSPIRRGLRRARARRRRRRGAAEPRRLASRLRARTTTIRAADRRGRGAPRARGGGGATRPRALPALRRATSSESKRALLDLLIELRRDGKQVVGYGAPGKGNTLLNYCGIRTDFLDYTVDRNPYKHGRFTPGTHIPIQPPERIAETRPDAILILPWNLAREIAEQLAYTKEWGARLIVPIPTATVSSLDQPRLTARGYRLAHARWMRPLNALR